MRIFSLIFQGFCCSSQISFQKRKVRIFWNSSIHKRVWRLLSSFWNFPRKDEKVKKCPKRFLVAHMINKSKSCIYIVDIVYNVYNVYIVHTVHTIDNVDIVALLTIITMVTLHCWLCPVRNPDTSIKIILSISNNNLDMMDSEFSINLKNVATDSEVFDLGFWGFVRPQWI